MNPANPGRREGGKAIRGLRSLGHARDFRVEAKCNCKARANESAERCADSIACPRSMPVGGCTPPIEQCCRGSHFDRTLRQVCHACRVAQLAADWQGRRRRSCWHRRPGVPVVPLRTLAHLAQPGAIGGAGCRGIPVPGQGLLYKHGVAVHVVPERIH